MQPRMDQIDWNQLRAFLETAEAGSLSAAARSPRAAIWLVTHRELRTSRRIRVVFETLAQGLASN